MSSSFKSSELVCLANSAKERMLANNLWVEHQLKMATFVCCAELFLQASLISFKDASVMFALIDCLSRDLYEIDFDDCLFLRVNTRAEITHNNKLIMAIIFHG